MSWASVVKVSERRTEEVLCGSSNTKGYASEVVVDTNALIRGVQLERLGERAVTVREVLGEVRDQKSREWLERMPFGVDVEEPEDEDVKAVTSFARATGDLTFLSKVDVKVIALARTRERITNGAKYLKDHPDQVKVQPKVFESSTSQPGWGTVPNPEDWEPVDRLNELEEQGRIAPVGSSSQSQILNSLETLALSENIRERYGSDSPENLVEECEEFIYRCDGQDDTIGTSIMHDSEELGEQSKSERGVIEDNKVHSTLNEASSPQTKEPKLVRPPEEEENGSEDGWQIAGKDSSKQINAESHPLQSSNDTESSGTKGTTAEEANDSSISCMTSDFSMQNVLIQMGLKVLSPDGRKIKEVKRWGMRCTACYAVTKEVGRMFCPKCGNASLQRVEIKTDSDGIEIYGARMRHRVRGTKYSLPMPKGGKKNKDPILSEDVMKERMKHLRTPNKNTNRNTTTDSILSELSEDTWFKASSAKHQMRDLLPNRRNPNERRHGKRRK